MASPEFSLIDTYFASLSQQRDDVVLGIGDDCAVMNCRPGQQLAVSIDTLVEGVHFFADVDVQTLGHKALAVSLSDLAAMGATPAWFTLALTLPSLDEQWLMAFAKGLATLARQHQIQLIGGDTTKGPLTISIQVHGWVEQGKALRRDGAKVGDKIFVSGTLGDAGAALKQRLQDWHPAQFTNSDIAFLQQRLQQPTPRNALSESLLRYANAAIDISDGLLADLGHILTRSQVGAIVDLSRLPLSAALRKLPFEQACDLALSAGDDYELCFTVSPDKVDALLAEGHDVHCIGDITDSGQCELLTASGAIKPAPSKKGYDHFSD